MRAFVALLHQHLREHSLAFALWSAVVALLSYVVASMAPAVADDTLLPRFLAQFPPQTLHILGHPSSYRCVVDYFVCFKWLQIMPLLGSAFGATMALGVIAKDIDQRTADFPLSLPVSRALLLTARFAALALATLLLYASCFLALWLSLRLAGLPASLGRYAAFLLGAYCISLAFSALSLLLSLTLSSYRAALRYALVLAAGAFLLVLLNRLVLGPRLVNWIGLYGLSGIEGVVGRGEFPWAAVSVGLALTSLSLVLCLRVFSRKQIPA